jgi:hypothetical protein
MAVSTRALVTLAALSAFSVAADTGAPLAGHWEGAISAPLGDVPVAVDLVADTGGKLGGTFSSSSQGLNGFPLWSANIDGDAVKLELKLADPGVRTFDGRLSADGLSIQGQFLIDVYAVPFSLKRRGDARITPPPKSAAIDAKLAGAWRGSLDLAGQSLPLTLTLTNHADRTATGAWSAGGAPEIPVAISYENGTLTLTSPVTPASFTGTLSADGTQISGMLNEGAKPILVVFTR